MTLSKAALAARGPARPWRSGLVTRTNFRLTRAQKEWLNKHPNQNQLVRDFIDAAMRQDQEDQRRAAQ